MSDEFDWYDPDSRAAQYARWMDTVSDPVHGRNDVPKSPLRMSAVIGVEKEGNEVTKIGIGSKDDANSFITSDTWVDLDLSQ